MCKFFFFFLVRAWKIKILSLYRITCLSIKYVTTTITVPARVEVKLEGSSYGLLSENVKACDLSDVCATNVIILKPTFTAPVRVFLKNIFYFSSKYYNIMFKFKNIIIKHIIKMSCLLLCLWIKIRLGLRIRIAKLIELVTFNRPNDDNKGKYMTW